MYCIRPVQSDDLPAILGLSERTGTGLTSLPADEGRLADRIERSVASFNGAATPADACYVFVLEDTVADRVVGISAIEASVGLKEPWYNYHVGTLVHASQGLGVYTRTPTLFLSNDHTDSTELCSLFLDSHHRRNGNGALLSKVRLLFLAEFREVFDEKVIAELRGPVDAQGRSPFWEGLGRHFFAMEFSRADYLTGIGQKSFIAELMPRHPVYTNLLSEDARAAIAEVHRDTVPARRLLESEGFRYEGYVDIFDGGPTLECFLDDIDAVVRSVVLPVEVEEVEPVHDGDEAHVLWLVASRRLSGYRALVVPASRATKVMPLDPGVATTLGVADGETVRAVPLSPRDRG